jgi:hypothetical protein
MSDTTPAKRKTRGNEITAVITDDPHAGILDRIGVDFDDPMLNNILVCLADPKW